METLKIMNKLETCTNETSDGASTAPMSHDSAMSNEYGYDAIELEKLERYICGEQALTEEDYQQWSEIRSRHALLDAEWFAKHGQVTDADRDSDMNVNRALYKA